LGNKKPIVYGILFIFIVCCSFWILNAGGNVRLLGMEPAGEVEPHTNLTFTFSEDMVKEEEVGVTLSTEFVKFTPAIPGKYRWVTKRELRFLPEVPLLPSTTYQAEVNSGLVSVQGKPVSGKRTVEFSTARFRVEKITTTFITSEDREGVILEARLHFNYPVSPIELEKALKLQLAGTNAELAYTVRETGNSRELTVVSAAVPFKEKEQKITITLPKDFLCVGGQKGLAAAYRAETTVGAKKPLQILNAALQGAGGKYWITVQCSEPVDAETAAGFIELKPGVNYTVETDKDLLFIKSDQFKGGENYHLRLNAGLPAVNGLPLAKDFAAMITLGDLDPGLSFTSRGRYLNSQGALNLGLETVNIERVQLEIHQIYANNLIPFLNHLDSTQSEYAYSWQLPYLGKLVKEEELEIAGAKNEVVTTAINLGQYMDAEFKGVFQVAVYDYERRWRNDYKYVIITDLGIVGKMGKNDLLVWVNSLETLAPKAKVKVSLISKNNQIMATAETDAQGIARFTGYQLPGDPAEPLIILAEAGNDFSFVHLKSSQITTTDFDVRGRDYLEEGYEAFAYLDRDIFRPGDEGNLVAVVRGPGAVLPPEFPVKLEVRQPDGQIFRELVGNTADRGACAFKLEIPDYAQTGNYQAHIIVGENVIGSTSFQVEEFMPDRIKVTVTPDRDTYQPGEECQIKVEGVNLFGPPAAGRRTEVKLRLEAADFKPPAYASYRFGDPDRSFVAKTEELGEDKLDTEGQATFTYRFPQGLTPPARLNAIIQATVIEDGGRAVSNYQAVTFHPYANYIGVKALTGNYCELGKPFSLKYVVLDPAGNPSPAAQLTAEVYHLTWNSIYRKDTDGRYRYVSEIERRKVYNEELTPQQGEAEFTYTPRDYGRYQIVLRDPKTEAQASHSFYASGWGYSPWAMEDPDKIELDLEQDRYQVGEEARLQIKAPFAGKALVTVERERVYDYWVVDLAANTGVVSIPVKEEYKPNAYLSVHLLRSVNGLEDQAPARAFGTIPLMVDNNNARLGVDLTVPAELRPNREVEIKVQVKNSGPGTYLTLAAVDEGICQLTDYAAPDPFAFFYGKRRLSLTSHDLYGLLLPEVEGMKTQSTPGGDRDFLDGVRKQNLNPVSLRRVKPVSLWSGLVSPDASGEAMVKFTLPQFNGTLRLMAVAFDGQRFGSAEMKTIVRDPLVMTPTFPRFVAPLDRFTVPVAVFNGTGQAGEFKLRLSSEGPVTLESKPLVTLELGPEEEQVAYFQLKASQGMGKLRFRLEVEGNGELCALEEELALRPPVPVTHQISSGTITHTEPLTFNIKDRWLPGTATYTLALSPFPTVELAGSLEYLLTYPHGCLEQTVSKLFPLLYFDQLLSAVEGGTFTGTADYYVTEGIEKIEAMQLRDGSFAYWPGGNRGNEWSSIYAAHFLVEARKAGYVVADRVYNRMISYLKATVRGKETALHRLQAKIYALYVLSLNGSPDLSTMAYWRRYASELSNDVRALLAGAYFYTGDRVTAREILPTSFAVQIFPRESGGYFNSTVRADAIILSVLAEVDPHNPAVYQLVNRLNKAALGGRWGTTQENAFALMALGKLYQEKSDGTYWGEVYLGKEKIAEFDSAQDLVLNDPRLAEGKITVKLEGDGECYYYLKSSGLSTRTDLSEESNGIQVTREFFDRHGNPVALNQIRQGDLLIARITIQPEQAGLEHVGIIDLLPAGLEMENPRIESRESISWLTQEAMRPDYMDVRDDRLILFFSFPKVRTYQFYYALRAVTCGEFILPSIKAECMYAPEIASFSSSGAIRVVRD
jgi:uncharacterized protein YfaS (alpha-2-macroglobulin family)